MYALFNCKTPRKNLWLDFIEAMAVETGQL